VRLGKGGVQGIEELGLAPDEQRNFARTAAAMGAAARAVDDLLS
jgi:hypothetical protein